MELKTVRVSDKGQIAIPADIRANLNVKKGDTLVLIQEKNRLLIQKAEHVGKEAKDEFKHLLKHSEEVAKKFWSTKADDVWDTL